jgi:two-component system chemotaxis sensor kinase CheA
MSLLPDFEIDRDELARVFMVEAREHLDAMEHGLMALEHDPDDPETIATIFRGAHTVKGGALSMGLDGLGELAHSVESLLERIRSGSLNPMPNHITLLLRSVDALRSELAAGLSQGSTSLDPAHRGLRDEIEKCAAARRPRASKAKEGAGPAVEAAGFEPSAPRPASEDVDPPAAATNSGETPRRRREDIAEERARTLRVDVAKLDRMLDVAGESAIARGRLRQILERLGAREALEAYSEAERLSLDLQEMVMKARMVPIGSAFRRFVRTVRDLAQSHGKMARLVIEGAEVEVDTRVIEELSDPLMHMVRNALDHGIESPEERRGAGKDPTGTLILRAAHEGSSVVIQLVDDGAGLARDRIRRRARQHGLIGENDILSDAQLFELLFRPGFSTTEVVTDLSGRGVGMDVVRRNIEALHGTVSLESPSNGGTVVTIRLPLTLAIIQGFRVSMGNETYFIPIEHVVECVAMPESERVSRRNAGVISLRGEPLPYLRYGGENDSAAVREHVVVVRDGEDRAGLVVDAIFGEGQTVIKPLGVMFKEIPGVAGSAIQANGRVALILDVPGLLRRSHRRSAEFAGAANE